MQTIQFIGLAATLAFSFAASAVDGESRDIMAMDEESIHLMNDSEYSPAASSRTIRVVRVRCESERRWNTNYCRVGRGQIRSIRLNRNLGWAPCIAGRTFGATSRAIWVRRGCGGVFTVRLETRGGRWDDRDRDRRERP